MSSSDLLYSLFEQHVNSNKSKSTNNNVSNGLDRYTQRMHRLHCIKHDTINEAMTKIELMVKESITQCAIHIHQTLNAIDNMSATNNTLIEQELLLSEAQLLTAASALKEFHAQITCAITNAELCNRNKHKFGSNSNNIARSNVVKQISSWFTGRAHKSNIHSNSYEVKNYCYSYDDKNSSNKESMNAQEESCTPSVDYYKHFDVILTVLESSVARWRLQLVLCKEELALYKNELVLFEHAGALTCSESDVKLLNDKLTTISNNANNVCYSSECDADKSERILHKYKDEYKAHEKQNKKNIGANVHSETDQLQPHFGLVTSVSRHTRWLLNDIVKLATGEDSWDADNSKPKSNTAEFKNNFYTTNIHDTNQPEEQPSSVDEPIIMQDSNNDVMEAQKINLASADIDNNNMKHQQTKLENSTSLLHMTHNIMHSPELITYSPDEEQVLQRQMMALHETQERASAHDAKQIETAVRELSQLTSLMNEQVVLQSEQFDVVLKNTEEAQRTMSRAVREVDRASQHFWNATRQLIVLLWLCIFVLLVANWLQSEAAKLRR